MQPPIRYLYSGGQGEITEKRSRFIATLAPVTTEEEAVSFIEAQKKRTPQGAPCLTCFYTRSCTTSALW